MKITQDQDTKKLKIRFLVPLQMDCCNDIDD